MGKERREKLAEIFNVEKEDLGALVVLCDEIAHHEKYDDNYDKNEDFEMYSNVITDLVMKLCGYSFDETSRRYVR